MAWISRGWFIRPCIATIENIALNLFSYYWSGKAYPLMDLLPPATLKLGMLAKLFIRGWYVR